jgi:uncharacterized membrane protein YfcA
MAYGVTSNSVLLSLGIPPAASSASFHAAEAITTGISGLSHHWLGNVDKDLMKRLVLPGVLGGVVGAYLLTSFPGDMIKPIVAVYLLIMGLLILRRAFAPQAAPSHDPNPTLLGLVGGFLDAVGGGGWGPIVTSTLVARGRTPRFAIGSVNASEFFVTFSESVTFFLTIGFVHWNIIGGVLAAPVAAYAARRLPARALMIMIGILITFLSIRTVVLSLQ